MQDEMPKPLELVEADEEPAGSLLTQVLWRNLASVPVVISVVSIGVAAMVGPGNTPSRVLAWVAVLGAAAGFVVMLGHMLMTRRFWGAGVATAYSQRRGAIVQAPRLPNIAINLGYAVLFAVLVYSGAITPYLRNPDMDNFPEYGGFVVQDVKQSLRSAWLDAGRDLERVDTAAVIDDLDEPDFVKLDVEVTGRDSAMIYYGEDIDENHRTYRYQLDDVDDGDGEWLKPVSEGPAHKDGNAPELKGEPIVHPN